MKHLLTIPVMALFASCAFPPHQEAAVKIQPAPPTDIPVVVKKRPAKYVGISNNFIQYALKNSRDGNAVYREDVRLAIFERDDKTKFSLNCSELDAQISLGLVTRMQPYTTFKEATDLLSQEQQYLEASRALKCPTMEA